MITLFLDKLIHLLLRVVKHNGDELLLNIVNLRLSLAVRTFLEKLLGEAAPLPNAQVPHQLLLLLAGIFGVNNELGQAFHPNRLLAIATGVIAPLINQTSFELGH